MLSFWLSLALGLSMGIGWTGTSDAACSGSGLSWSCPAGATPSDVNAAIANAADGATIYFDAGAYTWGGSSIDLDNTKGVTLDGGNKSAVVTIVNPGLTIAMGGTVSGNNTKVYRITRFTFQDAPAQVIFWFYGTSGAVLNNLRVDHNTFSNFHPSGIGFLLGANGPFSTVYGLFDHNLATGPVNFILAKSLGIGDPALIPSSLRGTVKNTYVEDNTFDFATMRADTLGAGCVDIWNSAGMVFRYNTTRNCMVTAHGTIHGGGAVNFELYKNLLSMDGGSVVPNGYRLFHHQGSGEFLAYQNVFAHTTSPLNASALAVTHYRSASCDGGNMYNCSIPRCDGTNANTTTWKDQNLAPGTLNYGGACWMQPGRAPAGGNPVYGILSPMYTWQNVDASTGSQVPLTIENYSTTPPLVTDHIKANRDYYNAVSNQAQDTPTSPFNGTTGMGFGSLENRPTTCTTNPNELGGGVGYFATDIGQQGVLYRCSASNSWTVHYTPYTYPHPLQALVAGNRDLARPDPPLNVQVK
ncbi:MAG: hypothetical protein H8K05_00215 [Nitrospira sp.]|nr:hypothetical protein [Nitrospira sp.]